MAKDDIPLTMTPQMLNCCVTSIMEFLGNEIFGRNVNQGDYDLYYLQHYGEIVYDAGVNMQYIYPFVEHFFFTTDFLIFIQQ